MGTAGLFAGLNLPICAVLLRWSVSSVFASWNCLHFLNFILVWWHKYMWKSSFKSQKGNIYIFTSVIFLFKYKKNHQLVFLPALFLFVHTGLSLM